jgi:F-type H+-transporting ATPase subunit b
MEENHTQATVAVEASGHKDTGLMSPDTTMVVLTWITFFLLLALLQKFVWKPLISALDKREEYIRKSLDDADKAKAQLAQAEEEKQKLLAVAKTEAFQIVEQARKTAKSLATDIEAKSRQQAQDIIKSAHEEIAGEKQRLLKTLRQESAEVAIALATKIIGENMDQDKNRKLVAKEIEQI